MSVFPNSASVPGHVGLIVDGNRRWARAHGLPTLAGHQRGYENVRAIARHLFARGVSCVTCFLFSSENWNREADEVSYLMGLLRQMLTGELESFVQEGVRMRIIGDRSAFSLDIQELFTRAEQDTSPGGRGMLVAALGYGAQQDIVQAARKVAARGGAESITREALAAELGTAGLPPLDMVIRTSGEQRLSNFLLWEAAYTELYFSPKPFPDFTAADADEALSWYASRERRFGK